MTSIPVRGVKIGKDGRLVKRPPRMAPVLASAKHKQAAREEKAWTRKSKPSRTTPTPT